MPVRLILNTGHPMYIFWGPELICPCNDACRASIGPQRHPGSLGQPAAGAWQEMWEVVGPQIDPVRRTALSVLGDDTQREMAILNLAINAREANRGTARPDGADPSQALGPSFGAGVFRSTPRS